MQTKNGRVEPGKTMTEESEKTVAVDCDGEPISDLKHVKKAALNKLATALGKTLQPSPKEI